MGPDLVFGIQQDQLLDRVVHCGDGLGLVHEERGEMLRRRQRPGNQWSKCLPLSVKHSKRITVWWSGEV